MFPDDVGSLFGNRKETFGRTRRGRTQISFQVNEPKGSKFRGIICSDSSKPFRDQ